MSRYGVIVAGVNALAAAWNFGAGKFGMAAFSTFVFVLICTSEIAAAIHRSKSR